MVIQSKEQEKKNLNIAIVQIYDDNIKEYAEYSRLLNAMYAKLHNYAYIGFEYDLVPVSVSVYYNKILAVETVLKDIRNFDWILYLDSDAAVSNFNYSIEDIIARHKDKEIIFARDINGSNNGVFLIKNTNKMKEFLRKAYEDKNFYHTEAPEQSAMFHYVQQEEYKNLVGFEPSSFLNAYLDMYTAFDRNKAITKFWDPSSFILHLPCLAAEDRASVFKQLLFNNQIICMSRPKNAQKVKVPILDLN